MFAIVAPSSTMTNCWSPNRFNNRCHRCERYDVCRFPDRITNAEYDALRAKAKKLLEESQAAYTQLKDMRNA